MCSASLKKTSSGPTSSTAATVTFPPVYLSTGLGETQREPYLISVVHTLPPKPGVLIKTRSSLHSISERQRARLSRFPDVKIETHGV